MPVFDNLQVVSDVHGLLTGWSFLGFSRCSRLSATRDTSSVNTSTATNRLATTWANPSRVSCKLDGSHPSIPAAIDSSLVKVLGQLGQPVGGVGPLAVPRFILLGTFGGVGRQDYDQGQEAEVVEEGV